MSDVKNSPDLPLSKALLTKPLEELFQAGAHLAYTRARRHPSVKKYIFGKKNDLDIFDLTKTEALFERAKEYMKTLGAEGKIVLFVGSKAEARAAILSASNELGMPYVSRRWIGGLLTNFDIIKKRTARLKELRKAKADGGLLKYVKKEQGVIYKELENLEKNMGGIVDMEKLPSALFVVDSREEDIAVTEARTMGIPVISISGSDCDIRKVDYPILANDASTASIAFITENLVRAYTGGKK